MNPMLAELSAYDPPVMILGVLGSLAFLFWIVNLATEFWRNLKDKPTGGEVMENARKEFQPKGHYVHESKFDSTINSLKSEDEKLHARIGGVDRGATKNTDEKIESVRKEVTSIGKDVSALQATTGLQNQTLARIETKLDRSIENR